MEEPGQPLTRVATRSGSRANRRDHFEHTATTQHSFIEVMTLSASLRTPVVADWWIVRSSDEKCLVVDTEPTAGRNATKIGKDRYSSVGEAEADMKHLCKGEGDGFER
jgi:hypothetical protein